MLTRSSMYIEDDQKNYLHNIKVLMERDTIMKDVILNSCLLFEYFINVEILKKNGVPYYSKQFFQVDLQIFVNIYNVLTASSVKICI